MLPQRYSLFRDFCLYNKDVLEKHPSDCWPREFKIWSQTIQPIVVVLVCLSEVESKFLLLEIPCASNIGVEGTELDLTWKPPPWDPHSVGRSSASCQGRKAVNSPTQLGHLWATVVSSKAKYAQLCNSDTLVSGLTNSCLGGLKDGSIGGTSCLVCKPSASQGFHFPFCHTSDTLGACRSRDSVWHVLIWVNAHPEEAGNGCLFITGCLICKKLS